MLISLALFVVSLRKQLPSGCFFIVVLPKQLWVDLSTYISNLTNVTHTFVLKDVIFYYYENQKLLSAEYVVNFLIMNAKFFIHKQKIAQITIVFPPFSCLIGLSCFIS